MPLQTIYGPTVEKGYERLRRLKRSVKVRGRTRERRRLLARVPRKPGLAGLIDETSGYNPLPAGAVPSIGPAIEASQRLRAEHRGWTGKTRKLDYNPTLSMPERYEDAPALVELALGDEFLQIACEYLGEIPILEQIRLWWTQVNDSVRDSQIYHRDGRQWLMRRAKFIVNMDDVTQDCGPFTFLPAQASDRVSRGIGSTRRRVPDEVAHRFVRPDEAVKVVGPAGAGVALDTSRCYHYGARARGGERLAFMCQFLRLRDATDGGLMLRSPAFDERYGDDPVRRLVIPNRG